MEKIYILNAVISVLLNITVLVLKLVNEDDAAFYVGLFLGAFDVVLSFVFTYKFLKVNKQFAEFFKEHND